MDRLSDIDEYDESCRIVEEHGYYSSDSKQSPPTEDDNISVDTGDLLCDDEDSGDDNEDSTPHILSETSKTQSPVSVDKVDEEGQGSETRLADQVESEVNDEAENFNLGEGETLREEIAFQIELESDKTKLTLEEAGDTNAKQSQDNKIRDEESFQQNLNCEDRSEERQKTDFGGKSGRFKTKVFKICFRMRPQSSLSER